jgi:uncharacterized damage-inducible protein DinB
MMPESNHDTTHLLVKFFEHHIWANMRLLDFCEQLSDEQLDAAAVGGYGSIRHTFLHMMGAEISYVERVDGKLPPKTLSRERYPTIAEFKETLRWTSEELLQLALAARAESIVHEEFVEQEPTPRKIVVEYKLNSLIVQTINHATEHRAQIATILTQLGLEPPVMDVWTYIEGSGEFRESVEEIKGA